MSTRWKNRGPTWQDAEWRRFLAATDDLGDRARAAFAKMRRSYADAALFGGCAPHAHDFARTQAPFTGDGAPAKGPFVIRPEYRGFA
jgi:hypothetical protein